ncbi:hypothetical protein [Pimelobacter simplex]|uniref:hypothetical protein n=1 Tax=Nocardioides simplex TaxID=2045 RepID=UPI0020B13D89|nr:hypothetical protein [Pimelobacter simplex]
MMIPTAVPIAWREATDSLSWCSCRARPSAIAAWAAKSSASWTASGSTPGFQE